MKALRDAWWPSCALTRSRIVENPFQKQNTLFCEAPLTSHASDKLFMRQAPTVWRLKSDKIN
jgi:hypothetical protein